MNITLDTNLRAARMLQGGRVTVTFKSEATGQHITIQAKCRAPKPEGGWGSVGIDAARVIFFEVPNQGGFNDKVGRFSAGRGFIADANADPARVYCAKKLLDFVAGKPMPTGLTAVEESACGCCGRALTDPVSIERGIGPECYGKLTGSTHETKRGRRSGVGAGRKAKLPSETKPCTQLTELPGTEFEHIFGMPAPHEAVA